MKGRKTVCIFAGAILLVFLIGVGIVFGVQEYARYKKEWIDLPLADTLVDGEGRRARVILLGGQSNASGCSHDEYLKKTATPEKYAEYERGYDNVYINFYATGTNASEGFVKCSVRQGELGSCFGPELGMAEKLHELYPNETVFLIKCAWGGTDLFEQWLSPSSDGRTGKLYRNFVRFVNQSLEYLVSKNYDVEVEGMCWMQGESDSFSTEHATDYEEHLNNFIKDIRKEFSRYASEDGIAFIDAYIADNPVYWVYCDLVNASKAKVAESSPLNVVIDTVREGLTCAEEPEDAPDQAHYDSQSEIKLGHLFIEALVPFMNG